MYSSSIELCNSALTKIGSEPIIGFTDGTKTSDACKLRYDPCRRSVLRLHTWTCAATRKILTPDIDAPVFGWGQQFTLPTDCLRILEINDNCEDFELENRKILINDSTVNLRYVFDLQDVSKMDDLLAEAIACRLAWDISYQITQSNTITTECFNAYKDALRSAKTPNAQEQAPREVTADYYLESRFAGNTGAIPKRNWPAGGFPI